VSTIGVPERIRWKKPNASPASRSYRRLVTRTDGRCVRPSIETCTLLIEVGEVQHMNVQSGGELWSDAQVGKATMDDDALSIPNGKWDRPSESEISVACFGRPVR
jgi:hypothetical protein